MEQIKLKPNFLYISFHKPKSIIGLLISAWTLGKYSHCEFIYNDKVYLANPGGVREQPFKYKKNFDIYEISALVNIEKVIEFFEMTKGSGYDYKGIIESQLFFAGKGHNLDEFFCSEWCLNAIDYALNYKLQYGKSSVLKKGYNKFNPERLYKYLKKIELIGGKTNERQI